MNILIIYSIDHFIMTIKTFFTTGRSIVLIMISEAEYPPPPKKRKNLLTLNLKINEVQMV